MNRPYVDQTNPFRYVKPTEEQVNRMKIISDDYISPLYEKILELLPASADRTLTIRKLQEFRMWVNLTIVLNED